MLLKIRLIWLGLVIFLGAVSCTNAEPTPVNEIDNIVSTSTLPPIFQPSVPAETPLNPTNTQAPGPESFYDDEITLLLHNRLRPPVEPKIIGLSVGCLLGKTDCEQGNTISVFPESLPQVSKLFWAFDGKRAFFSDSDTGDIYTVDRVSGEINSFKEDVWKINDVFFISPNGFQMIFEVSASPFESDIVSMDMQSGEISTFNIPIQCMKRINTWLTDAQFLFWCEVYTGDKGYLDDVQVYTFDLETQAAQPFDIGRDWMQVSIPYFSPNHQVMALTYEGNTIIRDSATGQELVLDINPEKYIWSDDSAWLAVFSQDKDIFIASVDGQKISKIYSFPENILLEDWLWLPGNEALLMIVSDLENGNKKLSLLSISNGIVTPVNLPLLETNNVISLSYRPTNK